jgi:hypothetical protein
VHPAAVRKQFDKEVAALAPRLLELRSWALHSAAFPLADISFFAFGRKTLRLHVRCDDWNDTPPSIVLLDEHGSLLARAPNCQKGVFNQGPHPSTGRPFICMRGSLEYHTHPSHTSDFWDPLKTQDTFTLFNIIGQVWHAWLKTTD